MHLSQPEGHAVISVKSCDRKSIALRKVHGKATALSVRSAFCFLPPSLHRDRAAWAHVWVLLTLCLSSSSGEAIQGIQSMCRAGGDGEQGGVSQAGYWFIDTLRLPGRQAVTADSSQGFDLSCALIFRKTSLCTSQQLHPALYFDVWINSKSLFQVSTQGRTIWPSSSRLWSLY